MPLKELTPTTPEELAEALADASTRNRRVSLTGAASKLRMGGPLREADVAIHTTALRRVLMYEPQDLTVSVEAGLPYVELKRLLEANRQMVPLDPPYSETATIGGILASNGSGPRRRLYGAARDLVIGMTFATLEGKLVQSGGMVVKNVAGLDMGKLMIGSFGTLAAIATVNFKLIPMPAVERTFLMTFESAAEAVAARDRILSSVLQPTAIDLLTDGQYALAVQAGGNAAVAARWEAEMRGLSAACSVLGGAEQETFWAGVREFVPRFLAGRPGACVVRVACRLAQLRDVLESTTAPLLARAGSGVVYACFEDSSTAAAWLAASVRKDWKAIMEFAPEAEKDSLDLWPAPGPDFEIMKRVKEMFDPQRLLNRDRLYRRI